MALIRQASITNARVVPQERAVGTGEGRTLFPWRRDYGWLVIAAEQLVVEAAASQDALLEHRNWVDKWNITSTRLADDLENLFPGLAAHLDTAKEWVTPWPELLKNRIYKMYYSGSSDRGSAHDARTRATISSEHWRHWAIQDERVAQILDLVANHKSTLEWMGWVGVPLK